MRALIALLAAAAMTVPADAHHKPGHPIPPGQMKKLGIEVIPRDAPPADLAVFSVETSDRYGWQRYVDEEFGFEVALPLGVFEVDADAGRGLHLFESSGYAELDVYGAHNPRGLAPRAFVEALEDADRIAEVTYRAEGRSWFVLSGYYADEEELGEPLIFYTKFMFSADRTRVSAFEISYPFSEKQRFDEIVSRMEASLSPPG